MRRQVAQGVSLELPADWRPLADSLQARVNKIVDSTISVSKDSALQAQLKSGHPVILFMDTDPDNLVTSGSMNITLAPGVTATTFNGMTADQLATALGPMCPALRDVMTQMGEKVLACDPPQLDQAAGRSIAVTHMLRTGRSGNVTVWMVQYPDQNVLYTLTLSSLQAEQARYENVYRAIWQSAQIAPQ